MLSFFPTLNVVLFSTQMCNHPRHPEKPTTMSELHPVIALYYQENKPSEDAVLAALRDHPPAFGVELITIANLAIWSCHTEVAFSQLLPSAKPGHERGRLIAAMLGFCSGNWMSSASGWWERLTQNYPAWLQELLLSDDEGVNGWERYLAGNFSVTCASSINEDQNALMARIAALLETQHPEAFHAPHPLFPDVSCAQVWAWLWASIPLRLPRLSHWGYLLNCDIDPNFAMQVEGGQMSMGTTLLWAMHPNAQLPFPSSWTIPPDFVPDIPQTATWLQYNAPDEKFNEEFPWQALWMLRQAGMDPAQLKEPTSWGTPTLGVLARLNQGNGQWTNEYLEKMQSRWLGLGLDMGAHAKDGRTLLDIATASAPKHGKSSPPLHPLDHWKISHACWSRALTPEAADRFWASSLSLRLLDDEPILKRALLSRICVEFDAWHDPSGKQVNPDIQALTKKLWVFENHQPLTPLGAVVMQDIQTQPLEKLFCAITRFILLRIKPDVALGSIEEIEARARALRLTTAFRANNTTSKMRKELAGCALDWANAEPENTVAVAVPVVLKSSKEEEEKQVELFILTIKGIRDHCTQNGSRMSERQLAHALSLCVPLEKFEEAKPPMLLACNTPTPLQMYWRTAECATLFDRTPKLIHALVRKLIEDFTSWPFEVEKNDQWKQLMQRFECYDTLPALETALIVHVEECSEKQRVGMALRLAGLRLAVLALTAPHYPAALETLALHYRTRPLSDELCTRLEFALRTWAIKVAPPLPPPDPDLRDKAAIKAEKERAPEDDRAIVLLYTEKALQEVGEWSSKRGEDNAAVKACRSRLVAEKPEQPAQLNNMLFQRHRTRRLALAQPAIDAMQELRSGFPHFEDVITQVQDHLWLAMCGDKSFSLPPLLMAGPPGTGKTFFFQELANKVATTYRLLNMESITAGFTIVGMDYGWSSASPGIVFDTLLADGATANPILLLDEIDKVPEVSNAPVAPVLLGLLEPHSARRFADRCFPLTMDVSRINWVATANYLDRVDLPLRSRFNIVHVANPDYNARCAMSRHIYKALRNTHSWGAFFDEHMPDETIQVLARPASAARDLRKNITTAFATAAREKRSRLLPSDIPAGNCPIILSPWDAPLPELPRHSHVSHQEQA
jgi:ATP-dependent Lon protease